MRPFLTNNRLVYSSSSVGVGPITVAAALDISKRFSVILPIDLAALLSPNHQVTHVVVSMIQVSIANVKYKTA